MRPEAGISLKKTKRRVKYIFIEGPASLSTRIFEDRTGPPSKDYCCTGTNCRVLYSSLTELSKTGKAEWTCASLRMTLGGTSWGLIWGSEKPL